MSGFRIPRAHVSQQMVASIEKKMRVTQILLPRLYNLILCVPDIVALVIIEIYGLATSNRFVLSLSPLINP